MHEPARPRRLGRPTKLTAEVRDRIVLAIKAGNYAEVAARHAGIASATFYSWMARGDDDRRGPYRAFRDAVTSAEAAAEVRAVATIQQAMPHNWVAAMTYLERKFPDRLGRRDRQRLSVEPPPGTFTLELDRPSATAAAATDAERRQ